MFIDVSVYFVIESVRKLLDTPSYSCTDTRTVIPQDRLPYKAKENKLIILTYVYSMRLGWLVRKLQLVKALQVPEHGPRLRISGGGGGGGRTFVYKKKINTVPLHDKWGCRKLTGASCFCINLAIEGRVYCHFSPGDTTLMLFGKVKQNLTSWDIAKYVTSYPCMS
jgi:hypothetical protein